MNKTPTPSENPQGLDAVYREAIDFAGIGLYRYKFDGTILFIDRGALRILEIEDKYPDPAAVVGKNVEDLLVYAGPKGLLRRTLREKGHARHFEYRFKTLAGKEKWALHDTYLVRDEKSGEKVIQVIIQDITPRKKAEEALREREEWLSTVLTSIGDAVIATDREGSVLFLNPVAEALTGWSLDAARGKPLEGVFHIINEETRARVETPVAKILKEGHIIGLANHTLLIAKDGTERPIVDSGAPIRSEDGMTVGVVLVFRDDTERRRAEKSLQESEEKFRTLSEEIAEGIVILIDEKVAWANPAFSDIFGYAPEELIGKHATTFTAPEAMAQAKARMRARLAGEPISPHYETVGIRKDGNRIHLEGTAKALVFDNKPAIQAVVRDVTERNCAEKMLREAHERLLATIAAMPDLIFEMDYDSRIFEYHAPRKEKLYVPPDTFLGKRMADVIPETIGRQFLEAAGQIKQTGEPVTFDYSMKVPQGDSYFEATLAPKGDPRAPGARVIAVVRDITDRRRAEREKAVVLDTMSEFLIYFDTDMRVVWANRAAAESLGMRPEQLVGMRCHQVWHHSDNIDDDECKDCSVMAALQTNSPCHRELVFPTGATWDIRAYPLRDESGAISGIVEIAQNITVRKRSEELLLNAKREAEFYLDLMSHDITNYNQNILGNLGLLERTAKPDEKQRKYLDTCKRQVDKIENLIAKVRAFSQVKNIENLALKPVNLNKMIADTLRLAENLHPGKTLGFHFAPPGEHFARGADLLESVFMNVIENAVKHTPGDIVWLDISIISTEVAPMKFWEVRIADKGPGVPDEMKEKIFDRYSRISREKGTGLGLSLARAIMEKLGGDIRVEDRVAGAPAEGSLFRILLPRE